MIHVNVEKWEHLKKPIKDLSEKLGVLSSDIKKLTDIEVVEKEIKENDMNDLTEKIRYWAVARTLHKADPTAQLVKLMEEAGELAKALLRKDQDKIIDSIGDCYVVLTIQALQMGLKVEDCVLHAYKEIADRKGKMIDGVFVKESDYK